MGFEQLNRTKYISYQREFLNREDIRDRINLSIENYNCENYYKLYLIYGIGGIGKTELLKKVRDTYSHSNHIIFTTFSDTKDTLRKLLDIRNHFVYAPQFDYLFLQYWENTKCEKLNEAYVNALNRQYDFFEEKYGLVSNIISGISPFTSYATDILRAGKNTWDFIQNKVLNKKFKDILEDINIEPEKLLCMLHIILSEDIQAEENKSSFKPIFIFDNYKLELLDGSVEWIREFINSFDNGIFIVTSRERLGWIEISTDMVDEVKLSVIPFEYAKEYMHKLSIDSKSIDFIIKKTACIPIYLDMAIALYFSSEDKNLDIMITDINSLIKAFLSHLSEDERRIAEILATIENFNELIYGNMLALNYLNSTLLSYNVFSQKSIMVDEANNTSYKINEVIARNIEALIPLERKQTYALQYLKIINTRCVYEFLPHEIMPYAVSAFIMIDKYFDGKTLKKEIIDFLFDMLLFLMDTAWVREFYEQLKFLRSTGELLEILKFLKGCVERQTNIRAGLQTLRSIQLEMLNGSKHKNTVICEINYLQSILGRYNEAEEAFRVFYCSLQQIDRNERFYVKGSIYHADMLMMRGQFKKALMIFKELEGNPYFVNTETSKSVYAEVLKQEGHCYRFNMQLEQALKYYQNNAFKEYEPIRIKAYRMTTECETLCYFQPKRVMENANEALEINGRIQNNNSKAKIYYSLAIANIHNKSYTKAKQFIEKSMTINNQTHYVAGNLFSLLALGYVEYAQNGIISVTTKERFMQIYTDIDRIYGYLLLPIYLISGEYEEAENLKSNFEWLDFTYTLSQYKKFLSIVRP